MKKTFLFVLSAAFFAKTAFAGNVVLNPWKEKPQVDNEDALAEYTQDCRNYQAKTGIIQSQNTTQANDPWANVRKQVKYWRGTSKNKSSTSQTTSLAANGSNSSNSNNDDLSQANFHNMEVMLNNLQGIGYNIPNDYAKEITNTTKQYKAKFINEYNGVKNNLRPVTNSFHNMVGTFQNVTGLNIGNVVTDTVNMFKN